MLSERLISCWRLLALAQTGRGAGVGVVRNEHGGGGDGQVDSPLQRELLGQARVLARGADRHGAQVRGHGRHLSQALLLLLVLELVRHARPLRAVLASLLGDQHQALLHARPRGQLVDLERLLARHHVKRILRVRVIHLDVQRSALAGVVDRVGDVPLPALCHRHVPVVQLEHHHVRARGLHLLGLNLLSILLGEHSGRAQREKQYHGEALH
mmetsp:Transcript_23422/g.75403  ORF Transcript_23422/g.75403 Transcript_23422/m.75403 type:complete len:212 (+) Transcript_23422:1127-1762(+)